MIRLWRVATVAPPRHLPVRMAVVLTGATSISRRKPNSRSQTIEMPENAAVNSTEVASTPGNRKVRKSTSPLEAISDDSPVPSTNRNSTGWTSEETIRERSRPKRIISRCQTTAAAADLVAEAGGGHAHGRHRRRVDGGHAAHLPRAAKAIGLIGRAASASRMVVPV